MIKAFFRITVLVMIVCALSWPFLPAQRQHFFMAFIKGDVDWRQLVLKNPLTGDPAVRVDPLMREMTNLIEQSELGKEVLASVHMTQQYRCEPVVTRAVTDKKNKTLYRWQDKQGRWHFGDEQRYAPAQATDISSKYQTKFQYFKLAVRGDDKKLPAFTRDKIRSDTKQIFSVLSDSLAVDYLRQVDLNLRLLASQEDFQKHRERVAPSLKTNSGFYSTVNNEAVIWQGASAELMHAVIRHESTHVIMAGLYGYPPVWLNEGMAEYFEQMSLRANSKTVVANPYWLALLRKQMPMSLSDYLHLSADQWRQEKQEDMYAMAWGLVNFLMADPQRKQFLATLLKKLAEHKCQPFSSEDFVRLYYPQGMAGLSQDWQQWLVADVKAHYY